MSEHSAQSTTGPAAADAARVVTRGNLERYLSDSKRKQELVTPLFDLIAPQYDKFTRAFSFGMDERWKRQMLQWVKHDNAISAHDVLDVACGTGDLALGVAACLPRARVHGTDVSTRMLELAHLRVPASLQGRLTFGEGDLMQLPAQSASVDVVTGGYAIRNAPEPRQALSEVARVLRPGGRLYILDFFLPASRAWRPLYLGYLRVAGAVVGWWWHRAPAAYEYIAASIEHFVTIDEFIAWLGAAGFRVEQLRRTLGGGVALIAAVRR